MTMCHEVTWILWMRKNRSSKDMVALLIGGQPALIRAHQLRSLLQCLPVWAMRPRSKLCTKPKVSDGSIGIAELFFAPLSRLPIT